MRETARQGRPGTLRTVNTFGFNPTEAAMVVSSPGSAVLHENVMVRAKIPDRSGVHPCGLEMPCGSVGDALRTLVDLPVPTKPSGTRG